MKKLNEHVEDVGSHILVANKTVLCFTSNNQSAPTLRPIKCFVQRKVMGDIG